MHWFTHVVAPILIVIALAIFSGYLLFTHGRSFLGPFLTGEGNTIRINNVPIHIDGVAATPESRYRGLSQRDSLPEGSGLLFVFEESGYYGIVMREMRFAIDVIWVGPDMRVVHIEHNLLPRTYPKVFEPAQPAQFVIETNAHLTESFGLKVGDLVEIPDRYIPANLK